MTSHDLADIPFQRLARAEQVASATLLEQRDERGNWEGELSTSALSTATATLAIHLYAESGHGGDRVGGLQRLVVSGCDWLLDHQNEDGGWGDTTRSFSNISTTMLAHATLTAVTRPESETADDRLVEALANAQTYIDRIGGVEAVLARYGRDRTFSVPILTHCALAGLVEWRRVIALPFELAALPSGFYKTVRLPVVSYALPALIAIGLVRFHSRRPWNPLAWLVRRCVRGRVLRVLESIQPTNGGFLEAAPLTSFVAMSLVGCGLADHRVTRQAINFLVDSVRDDGSWPIDTNLATWVTTLSVNALGNRLPESGREPITNWLLGQQFREVHPYTNADPGGWSWTDLPGGVPDADDTPGAMLALLSLEESPSRESIESIKMSSNWLLSLQNRDGGWPTFCRGWGTLPFDRSSQDITAHVLRALMSAGAALPENAGQFEQPIDRGFEFLREQQREDGAWVPLWFGNQRVAGEQNPVYGTARVLMAWWDAGRADEEAAVRAREWLSEAQNPDGGWGGDVDTVSSVEETALAVEALLGCERGTSSEIVGQKQAVSGVEWLIARVEAGTWIKSEPIGFYFAKLWYFERLYPLIFTVSALRRALSAAKGKYDSLSDDMPLGV